jgi:hypothetical protein
MKQGNQSGINAVQPIQERILILREHLRNGVDGYKQNGQVKAYSKIYTRHTSGCMCVGFWLLVSSMRLALTGRRCAAFKSAPDRFVVHPGHSVRYAPGDE